MSSSEVSALTLKTVPPKKIRTGTNSKSRSILNVTLKTLSFYVVSIYKTGRCHDSVLNLLRFIM